MARWSIVFLVIFIVSAIRSGAQSYVGGAGMVNAGYLFAPGIASSLSSNTGNSLHFQKGYAIVGAELNYRRDQLIIAASGYIGASESRSSGEQLIEPFIWKAHIGSGPIVYQSKAIALYPIFGIGAIQSSVIYHNYSDADTYSETTSPSMEFALHLDYLLHNDVPVDEMFGTSIISTRITYTHDLTRTKLNGWSVTVSFGGMGFMKRKR